MRHLENVCFITYEEMKNDLASVIRKVSAFLTHPVAEENIPSLVDHLSFDKMKKNKSVNKQEFVDVSNRRNVIFDSIIQYKRWVIFQLV